MSAEVRPGYKQTEVGLIPEEWVVRQLSKHFNIYAGGDVPKHSLSQNQSESHPHPIFANALQNEGLYGYTSECRSKGDSLTITARGYLGHAEYRSQPFFPIVRLLVLEPTGELDAKFTSYVINDRVKFPIESTGVPQLTAPQLEKYSVASPPTIFEQCVISQALSDMDALISSLDQLIAKKRDIQQAVMQQLLTGQLRLLGFSGEWEVKRLGEICAMKSGEGITSANIDEHSAYPCYGGNGLRGQTDTYTHDGSYVLIGRQGALCGNIVLVRGRFFASEHAIVATPFSQTDVSWLSIVLRKMNLNQYSESSAQPGLSVSKLLLLPCLVPPLPEQTTIATILSDMDTELVTLEARRDKARQLKQGMMQELLTGRIRLINSVL